MLDRIGIGKQRARIAAIGLLGLVLGAGCSETQKSSAPPTPPPQPKIEAAVSIDAASPAAAQTPSDVAVPRAEDQWIQVPGLSDAVALVAAGGDMCALRKGGSIVCSRESDEFEEEFDYGKGKGKGKGKSFEEEFDEADEEGYDDEGYAVVVSPADAAWVQVKALNRAKALGEGRDGELCAVKKKGTVECLDLSDESGKVVKIPGMRNAVSFAAGYLWSCALTNKGALYCQSVDEMSGDASGKAVRIKGLPPLVSIAMGDATTGGIDRKGRLWAWDADGGEEQMLTPRTCKPGPRYLAEDRKKITCTEGSPAALQNVKALVMLAGDVSLDLFYALVGDRGVYAYTDKAHGDKRSIGKDSGNARLFDFVEDFKLPANTERLLAAPPIACSVARDGAVQCWGDEEDIFGPTPRPTPIRSPIAIAKSFDHLCALSKAGTVSCMSLVPPDDDEE